MEHCYTAFGLPKRDDERGFTLIELIVALTVLSVGILGVSQVFLTSLKTTSHADARTRATAIATREVEAMRAPDYARVGFATTDPAFQSTWSDDGVTYETVVVDDPATTAGVTTEVWHNETFSTEHQIVWVANGSVPHAYKRIVAIVTWTDSAGPHQVRNDAGVYPGGLGPAGSVSTSTTAPPAAIPATPIGFAASADAVDPYSQIDLSWTIGSPEPQYWEIETSTDSGLSWVPLTSTHPGTATTYDAGGLASSKTYQFRIRGLNGAYSSGWATASASTSTPVPACAIQTATVSPATVRKKSNNKLLSDLRVTVNTTGSCSGLKVRYPASGSPAAITMTQNGTVFTHTLDKNAYSWSTGVKTILITDSLGTTTLATISLTVTT